MENSKSYQATIFTDSAVQDLDPKGLIRSDDLDPLTIELFGKDHISNPKVSLTDKGEIIFEQVTPHATPPKPRDYLLETIPYNRENRVGTDLALLEVRSTKRSSDQLAQTTIKTRQPVRSLTVKLGNYPLMPETSETLLTIVIGSPNQAPFVSY